MEELMSTAADGNWNRSTDANAALHHVGTSELPDVEPYSGKAGVFMAINSVNRLSFRNSANSASL